MGMPLSLLNQGPSTTQEFQTSARHISKAIVDHDQALAGVQTMPPTLILCGSLNPFGKVPLKSRWKITHSYWFYPSPAVAMSPFYFLLSWVC